MCKKTPLVLNWSISWTSWSCLPRAHPLFTWRRMNYNHELLKKMSVLSKCIWILEHKDNTCIAFNIKLLEKDHLVPEQWFLFILILFLINYQTKRWGSLHHWRRADKVLQTFHYFIYSFWVYRLKSPLPNSSNCTH